MDGITLDALVAEIGAVVVGRHIRRLRVGAHSALVLEIAGERDLRLWLDAGRGTAGCVLLRREEQREAEAIGGESTGRARHALLYLRKHLEGARIERFARLRGERTLVLEAGAGAGLIALRLSGPAPALTLIADGRAIVSFGDGPEVWPLPVERPEREWDRLAPEAFEAQVEEGRRGGRALARAILAACPSLGPVLAAQLDGSAADLLRLRERLRAARPLVVTPRPIEACRDSDLAGPRAVDLAPTPPEQGGQADAGLHLTPTATWNEAAVLALRLRLRGRRFAQQHHAAVDDASQRVSRLARLEVNLARDLAGLPDASRLRREAEALLASPHLTPNADGSFDVADPSEPGLVHHVVTAGGVSLPAHANQLFARARRLEGARRQVEARLAETRAALAEAGDAEDQLRDAHDVSELPLDEGQETKAAEEQDDEGTARRYLTSRGIEMLVGRNAKENQRLSFEVARPDDVWCHALDVPGSHVILRDGERRANVDDEREAAEVAAFCSGARGNTKVDVHVTRRKFVLPIRGTPGRVRVAHSEVRRVTPRDPEGRLRRR